MNDPLLPVDDRIATQLDGYYQYLSRKYPLVKRTPLEGMFPADWFEVSDVESALEIALAEQADGEPESPYWCTTWPSAFSLAAFLQEEQADFSGKQVLDLGCGPGITGVAAGFCHANKVVFNDLAVDALRLAAINWMLNHKTAPTLSQSDWRQISSVTSQFDVILASDVAYEAAIFHPLIMLFSKLLKPDGHILLAEPNRPFAKAFFEMLRENQFEYKSLREESARNGQSMLITIYDIWQAV